MMPQGQQPEEEDSDYDVFASVRPQGITVDDNPEDEASGEDLDPLDQFRPVQTLGKKTASTPKKKQFSDEQINKEVSQQAIKGTLIGLGGTWGDLAELAGVNAYDDEKDFRNYEEHDVLSKMKEPGYKPSIYDIAALEGDDGPQPFRLPSSKNLESANDAIGGPGEPETGEGKYSNRASRLYGGGLAFGQVNPGPALLGAAAGTAAEELGFGPLGQTVAEIATLLATQGRGAGKTLVGSAKKEAQDKINKLRELGYSDADITLAINSASKGRAFGIKASKGSKTERAFEDFTEHSDELVRDILEKQIPGFEKGSKHLHEVASDAYGQVVKEASRLNIKNLDPFFDSMHTAMKDIRKNIGHNPDAKNFITELTEHTLDIISNPTADNMIDFYKRLNGLGKWMGRDQKDRIITGVKNSIKDTFRAEGKAGKELATKFEKVNEGIVKAYKAEDLLGLVDKARTQDGIDYKKLTKVFDKKDNVALFEEVLGVPQARNLQQIAKVGKEVKDFDKAWKATSLLTGTPTSIASNVAYLIYSGNWPAIAAMKGMEAVGRKLAEKSLTDPKFQNLLTRGLHAIKNESPRSFRAAEEGMSKYLKVEGLNINPQRKDSRPKGR